MKKGGEKKLFRVPRALIDTRLDRALVTLFEEAGSEADNRPSRAFWTRLIKEGGVTVNGRAMRPTHLLGLGDRIEVAMPEHLKKGATPLFPSTTTLRPEIVFENRDFLVLNKPAGFLVHPTKTSTEETLAHFLVAQYPATRKVGEAPERPGVAHRLDRETSGLLLLAKNQKTYLALKALFQSRSVQKTYLALVYGHLPALSGKIDTPLGRTSGALKRRTLRPVEQTPLSRSALTEYRVLKRYTDYDLVAASPKTGRTHQIRVHLASLGHPVVGDKLYAFRSQKRGGKREKALFPGRHLLHAWRLAFTKGGQKYALEAPLPGDFQEVLKKIGSKEVKGKGPARIATRSVAGGVDETSLAGYDDEALKSLELA